MLFSGGYTQMPHLISDVLHEMSWPEWVCTAVLVRETLGWQQPAARLTQAEFLRRTPIKSRSTLIKALQAVEARGFFRRTKRRSEWVVAERLQEDPVGDQPAPAKGSTGDPYGELKGSAADQCDREKGSPGDQCGPAKRSTADQCETAKGSAADPFLYNKEKETREREEREREKKGPTPAGRRRETLLPQGQEEAPEMPRPRTAAEQELAQHPAAAAWLAAGLPWPGYKILRMITRRLGREPQLEALTRANELWLMAGYRPSNFGGILDWYESLCHDPNWRPFHHTAGHTGPQPAPQQAGAGPPPDPTMAMLLQMLEEAKYGKQPDYHGMFDPAQIGLPKDDLQPAVREGLPAGPGRH